MSVGSLLCFIALLRLELFFTDDFKAGLLFTVHLNNAWKSFCKNNNIKSLHGLWKYDLYADERHFHDIESCAHLRPRSLQTFFDGAASKHKDIKKGHLDMMRTTQAVLMCKFPLEVYEMGASWQ